ncbi:MAG: nucleoside kinase, partial [Erysipelotrichaceae bacterium]|nr:nucleoside kinase [Erysipelotrichaceae bacterium]
FEKQAFDQQVANIPDINKIIENNQYATLVMQDEKRLKDDVSDMIDLFLADKTKRVILMSGPSSSGKTTLTKNIQQQLLHHGHDTLALSLDDFFLERDQTPLLPDGSYDFENITCIDLNLFNDCINSLLNGKAYHLPIFDFIKGQKIFAKEAITLHPDQILLIEGLHALNPKTSQHIPSKYIFKVYINALTHLNLDNHNYISTSDYRMIRRMTRDIQYRNQSIQDTIRQWPKVKDGENKYIYPYQEDANYIINTSMCYEMPIFRKVLIPLLLEVDKKSPEYITAQRIKRILSFFCPGEPSIIPDDSILKEFIGF